MQTLSDWIHYWSNRSESMDLPSRTVSLNPKRGLEDGFPQLREVEAGAATLFGQGTAFCFSILQQAAYLASEIPFP